MINDEVLGQLIKTLEESNKKTIEEANRKQSEDIKQNIKKEIHQLKSYFEEELNKKSVEFEIKYKELKVEYEKLEKKLRKNSIIIFGLDTPVNTLNNLGNFIINEINQRLGIVLTISDINNVYYVGKQNEKRPIVVDLVSFIKKVEILRNSKKLKGTNISIAEELTIEERRENKVLRQHLKEARTKKLNAYIKNGKLIINGQQYSAQELTNQGDTNTENVQELGSENEDDLCIYTKLATKKNYSDPGTPTKTKEDYLLDTQKEDEEVFEIKNVQESLKKKVTKPYPAVNTATRTSHRLNSNKESKKIHTSLSAHTAHKI